MVSSCGYDSGRALGGVGCTHCTYAETIPPVDPYRTITALDIRTDASVATIQRYVTNAKALGGGWLQLVFHDICDGCDPTYAVSPATLTTFLDWLAAQQGNGVEVKTVQQVMATPPPDNTAPVSSIACAGQPCSSGWYTGPTNVTLSATDDQSGVAAIRYTTDGSTPTGSSPLYTGQFSVSQTQTITYRAWDQAGNAEDPKSKLIRIDADPPTSSIACGGSSCTSQLYQSPVSVSLQASDANSGVQSTHYTIDGSDPTLASPTYSQPLTLSSTTTVKYRSWDVAGNAESIQSKLIQVAPPSGYQLLSSSAANRSSPAPLQGKTVSGNIYVFLSPDTSVTQARFYLDNTARTGTPNQTEGIKPYDFAGTAGDGTASPYDTTKIANGQHTITVAVDVTDRRHPGQHLDLHGQQRAPPTAAEQMRPRAVLERAGQFALPARLRRPGRWRARQGRRGHRLHLGGQAGQRRRLHPRQPRSHLGRAADQGDQGHPVCEQQLARQRPRGGDRRPQPGQLHLDDAEEHPGGHRQVRAGWAVVRQRSEELRQVELVSTSAGTKVEYLIETNDTEAGSLQTGVLNVSGASVQLRLQADPVARTVTASYSINGATAQTVGTFTAPAGFFSLDATPIDPDIGTRSFAGVFATQRNAASPPTYTFDDFGVTGQAPLVTQGTSAFGFGTLSFPISTGQPGRMEAIVRRWRALPTEGVDEHMRKKCDGKGAQRRFRW